MSRRLTLHLTARHNAALDRILGGDNSHDNNQRRRAVEQLILDGAHEPEDRAGAQNTAVVGPPGATDRSAARNDTESTVRLIDRLKASRDRYRDLAVRAEAALLGVPVRDDYGSIERRLERALRDKGFEMPAATRPRRPVDRPPAGSRRRGGR